MSIDKSKGMAAFQVSEEAFDEILVEFVKQANSSILVIRKYIDNNQWNEVVSVVHTIKGITGNLRLDLCFQYAKDMERALHDGVYEGFPLLLSDLQNAVDEVQRELRKS